MQEVEQLRQEKLEIEQQLRAIHGNNMGSIQNFPLQRRSDRGYSSDIDSMRSNRQGGSGGQSNQGSGGMRGRGGRGGRGNNQRYHPGNNLNTNNDNLTRSDSIRSNKNETDQDETQSSQPKRKTYYASARGKVDNNRQRNKSDDTSKNQTVDKGETSSKSKSQSPKRTV